jgi:hypothetical protein
MTWILLALLVYTLIGATLVAQSMGGMHVDADPREWLVLIFLWPLLLRFFLQLAVIQAEFRRLEQWEEDRNRNR